METIYKKTTDINDLLMDDEKLLWQGKPQHKAFVWKRVLRTQLILLPRVIMITCLFIIVIAFTGSQMLALILFSYSFIFFLLYLRIRTDLDTGNVLWEKAQYFVSDRRVIIKNGLLANEYLTIDFSELKNIESVTGWFNKLFKAGDIFFNVGTERSIVSMDLDPYRVWHRKIYVKPFTMESLDDSEALSKSFHAIIFRGETDVDFPQA